MKSRMLSLLVLSVAGVSVSWGSASWGQGPPVPKPSKEHRILRKDAGVWDAVLKVWAGGPDAEPMTSKGVEKNRMLGGMWIISNFAADFGGQDFKGHGQFGYDTSKKKYVGTWIDSMSPTMMTMEGEWDDSNHSMTYVGKSLDPMGNQVGVKNVTTYDGPNKRLFVMYMQTPDGKWVKSMEITYTRRVKKAK